MNFDNDNPSNIGWQFVNQAFTMVTDHRDPESHLDWQLTHLCWNITMAALLTAARDTRKPT